jgi:Rod binding domain-containing protein
MADAGISIQRGAPLPLQAQAPTAVPDRALQGAPLPLDPHVVHTNTQAARMRHTAEEFESVFLNEMLSPMFEGLSTEGIGGGGVGEEMFRPMLIDRYAQSLTHAGGIGIADQIMRELTRMQANQTAAHTPDDTDNGSGNGSGR